MKLNDLKPASGSKKSRRRVGRGLGSGRGKTAGRGQKGQSSRSGFSQGAGWEGGRSRLIMRLPKRGFNREKELFQLINLEDLGVFEEGAVVSAETLKERGLVRYSNKPVKLLGRGELEVKKLQVDVDAVSRSAARAIIDAGGSVRGASDVEEGEAAQEPAKKPAKKAGKKEATKANTEGSSAETADQGSVKSKGAAKSKKVEGEAAEGSTTAASKEESKKASASATPAAAADEGKAKAEKPAEEKSEGASEDSSGEEQA